MTEIMKDVAAVEAITTEQVTEVNSAETIQPADILGLVSDDLKTVKSLEKFKGKDINELAKSYLNLEKLVGVKAPTAPEKYVLAEEASNLINEQVLEIAKKSNVTQDQLKALTDKLVEVEREKLKLAETEAQAALDAAKQELEKEFGVSLDKRLDSVKKVLSQYGDENLTESLKNSGLLHDAKFVKFLDKITQDVLQVKMVGSDFEAQLAPTPAEAQALMSKKYASKEFCDAYFDNFHPGHKAAVEEMRVLSELATNA